MNFAFLLSLVKQYMPLALIGVHAAASVPAASNTDKRTTVIGTIVGVTDAVAAASGDPMIEGVGLIVDLTATIINRLTAKTAATGSTTAPASVTVQVVAA